MVVFLRQGLDAGEDAVGGLEAGAAVVPVYAKERVLGFLPGIKVVSISRICNAYVDFLAIRIVIIAFQNTSGIVENHSRGAQVVGDIVVRQKEESQKQASGTQHKRQHWRSNRYSLSFITVIVPIL